MRYGLCLTPFAPLAGNGYAGYRDIARAARDAGFADLVAGENYVSHPHWTPPGVPLLAALAAETGPDMRLVLGITLAAIRNPVVLAEEITLLDQVSDGRAVVGVGLGWREPVFRALGHTKAGSVTRLVDNLRVMRGLWAGEPVDFDSPYCRLTAARAAQLPVQRPGPPVWMAGHSDGAIVRAAQLADTWLLNPHARRPVLARQLAVFRRARAEAGLPPVVELPLRREVFVSADPRRAREEAARALTPLYESLVAWGHDAAMPPDDTMAGPFEQLSANRFVIGDPEGVRAELAGYAAELGVSEIVVRLAFPGMDTREVCERVTEFGALVISR
jgi:alkanesulfonate monooxygenase SsuD/methylene tetrahydromethanopterin reductase-like flavin-dependent oxidoreductase (luciferase family)